jgi:hypothetical protein
VPVIATARLGPSGTLFAEMVTVVVPAPVINAGLKLAVIPVDCPRNDALKLTFPLKPFAGVTVTVTVAWPPGVTVNVLGAEASVKSAPTEVGAKALIRFCPFGEPKPVTRSYPGTAEYRFGLAGLKLLPVVMSWKSFP